MSFTSAEILTLLQEVKDPEVPAISVVELGIIRQVEVDGDAVMVTVTPTYSGCPAIKVIEEDIAAALRAANVRQVHIKTAFTPAWSTDWITEEGKRKLRAYGIAPPGAAPDPQLVRIGKVPVEHVVCPFCESPTTHRTSQFGPTACKALYFCDGCQQPFEYFKAY